MRLWYRDGLLKATLAVIVGTLTFSFALLRRVSTATSRTSASRWPASSVVGSCSSCSSSTGSCTASVPSRSPRSSRRPAGARSRRRRPRPPPVAAVDIPEGAPALRVTAETAGAIQAVHAAGLVRWAQSTTACRPAAGRRRLRPLGPCADRRSTVTSRARRAAAPQPRRLRRRADDRPGRRLRRPDHGRRRDQGAVAGGERPDDCRPGARPPRGAPARDRHDRASSGAASCATTPAGCASSSEPALGGLPLAGRDGDPRVRGEVDPGAAPSAHAARRPAGGGARGLPPGGGRGDEAARRDRRGELRRFGRPRPGHARRPPGIGGPHTQEEPVQPSSRGTT